MQNFERPSRAIIVIVFLIASSFLLWQFWRPSEEDETKEVSLAPPLEEAGIEDAERIPYDLPVVAADKAWSEADEAELQALVRQLEGWEEGEQFSATVGLGETLITEGFEKDPGVFVFATLTAEQYQEAETQPEIPENIALGSQAIYRISVRQFEIDIGGGKSVLSAPEVLVKAGQEAAIQLRIETLTEDGEFRASTRNLEVLIEQKSDSTVRLSGSQSVVEE